MRSPTGKRDDGAVFGVFSIRASQLPHPAGHDRESLREVRLWTILRGVFNPRFVNSPREVSESNAIAAREPGKWGRTAETLPSPRPGK